VLNLLLSSISQKLQLLYSRFIPNIEIIKVRPSYSPIKFIIKKIRLIAKAIMPKTNKNLSKSTPPIKLTR
jgi:hypothetical protein